MIVVTGAAGFIGSCLVSKLNENNFNDLILVDDFTKAIKKKNYYHKKYKKLVEREVFFQWLDNNHKQVEFIFHIGARTDTTEFDLKLLYLLNTEYTKIVWRKCYEYGIPLIYCSSAATYGDGSKNFDDNTPPNELTPLNAYGISKNDFDKWAILQKNKPYFNIGLKFFNVYGPNEYHKLRMASVIYNSYKQILKDKQLNLFKSHRPDFKDGEQLRDFIYVKDVINIMYYFMNNRNSEFNGIYNIGTGQANSFNNLASAIFKAMKMPKNIKYIDIPEDIREKYQYFTEAKIEKLRRIGYNEKIYSLEEGVSDYVNTYLKNNSYL
ncbi:MAG: ADP-glyceromanno-heptose 6-epimerase [Bacteroidales bacterium]|jgi:ADP-L-glycero-D-manno-heptose 6-epimerase|nr:ADP-glyceromanno-heptose 6-epimerase [Bacteroidales bacterium]